MMMIFFGHFCLLFLRFSACAFPVADPEAYSLMQRMEYPLFLKLIPRQTNESKSYK